MLHMKMTIFEHISLINHINSSKTLTTWNQFPVNIELNLIILLNLHNVRSDRQKNFRSRHGYAPLYFRLLTAGNRSCSMFENL